MLHCPSLDFARPKLAARTARMSSSVRLPLRGASRFRLCLLVKQIKANICDSRDSCTSRTARSERRNANSAKAKFAQDAKMRRQNNKLTKFNVFFIVADCNSSSNWFVNRTSISFASKVDWRAKSNLQIWAYSKWTKRTSSRDLQAKQSLKRLEFELRFN